MKKVSLPAVLAFVVVFTACGPAAENRDQMLSRSKVFQDSIANVIKVSMAEAAAPGPAVAPAPAATATAASVAPQPGNKNK